MENTTTSPILTEKEACSYFKVSRQTLKNWRDAGVINYTRLGRTIRYSANDLNKKFNYSE